MVINKMKEALEEAYGKEEVKRRKNKEDKNSQMNFKKEKQRGNPVSWWDKECQEVLEKRKESFTKFRRTGKVEDFIEYKRLRAIARKVINKKKREDLHRFAFSLNKNISIKYVWGKMKSLKKSWIKVNWNKWQVKNRNTEVENTVSVN